MASRKADWTWSSVMGCGPAASIPAASSEGPPLASAPRDAKGQALLPAEALGPPAAVDARSSEASREWEAARVELDASACRSCCTLP